MARGKKKEKELLVVYLIFQFLATSLINSTQLTSRESPK